MSGISPDDGVVAGHAQVAGGISIAPAATATGCAALYHKAGCKPPNDRAAWNWLIANWIDGLNQVGLPFDCTATNQLYAMICAIAQECVTTAPDVVCRSALGVGAFPPATNVAAIIVDDTVSPAVPYYWNCTTGAYETEPGGVPEIVCRSALGAGAFPPATNVADMIVDDTVSPAALYAWNCTTGAYEQAGGNVSALGYLYLHEQTAHAYWNDIAAGPPATAFDAPFVLYYQPVTFSFGAFNRYHNGGANLGNGAWTLPPGAYWKLTIPAPVIGSTCFPAGSLVLMADGTKKPIEEVAAGDLVWSPKLGADIVSDAHPTTLGARKLYRMNDDSLRWSEEHSFWVDRGGDQRIWSMNVDMLIEEARSDAIIGLADWEWPFEGAPNAPEMFGREDGTFASRTPVRVRGAASTEKLYFVETRGGGLISVNGYIVGAGLDDDAFDYKAFKLSKATAKK